MSKWLPYFTCIFFNVGIIYSQDSRPAEEILREADRLAFLRAWTRAEPLFAQAAVEFDRRGDRRNSIYAEVSKLRGQLSRNSVAEMSRRFAEFLADPVVRGDDRLRLRCLAVKGDTDLDLDPNVAEKTWSAAKALAVKLGDQVWANRAEGELAIVAALQGRTSETIQRLGDAITTAQKLGDVSSEVRWLTVFGQGFTRFGMADQGIVFYDRALEKARPIPEIEFPLMTYVGKSEALMKLKRFDEAGGLLNQALAVAREKGAFGYQAELTRNLAAIAKAKSDAAGTLRLLEEAAELGRKAGGERILLEVAIDLAQAQKAAGKVDDADATLGDAIATGRRIEERFLLPRLLKQAADLRVDRKRLGEASELLDEAADLVEGLLVNANSPWVKERLIAEMDDIFAARIALEGSTRSRPDRLFLIVEQARGRVLMDLLLSRSVGNVHRRPDLEAAEDRLAVLQSRLLRATDRKERRSVLDDIYVTEKLMGPGLSALFMAAQADSPRRPVALSAVQRKLGADELLLHYTLSEPASLVLAITRAGAKVHRLAGRKEIEGRVEALLRAIRSGTRADDDAVWLGRTLIGMIGISSKPRLLVCPDGALHGLPFDLLAGADGRLLVETHSIQKIPSATVLTLIRSRTVARPAGRRLLAVSASGVAEPKAPIGSVNRGLYDLDGAALPPLPSANDEARAVGSILNGTVLIGDDGSEARVKAEPLGEYAVLHFAAHGLMSPKDPERSAVILRPGVSQDGLLQSREILGLRLNSSLVTLSACDTGTGALRGQDGVSSLVRPFIAAGARSVVANLWSADDTFSLTLMKEFYRGLAGGRDVASALRLAKLKMRKDFGEQASPRLWAGLEVHGDGREAIAPR